jgi:cbb3-type cytochrome oxidase maturation protein
MNIIYLLIAVSFFIALLFLVAFFIAIRTGQYDDIHTPPMRILFQDEIDSLGYSESYTHEEPNPTN